MKAKDRVAKAMILNGLAINGFKVDEDYRFDFSENGEFFVDFPHVAEMRIDFKMNGVRCIKVSWWSGKSAQSSLERGLSYTAKVLTALESLYSGLQVHYKDNIKAM